MGGDLRIRLLGGLSVEATEQAAFGSRKARTLLARLAVSAGTPVDAAALIDAVWPDGAPGRPADQLAVLVSRLRAVLGSDRIERRDAGYLLTADWVDTAELDALVDDASARLAAGSVASARAGAAAALALDRGPLLPEHLDAAWAEAARANAERRLASARRILAEAALAAGMAAEAVDAATRALDAEPYDEHALRLLMRACAAAGRTGAALTAYERTRRQLDDELGVGPEPATEQMYLSLLRADAPAPPEPAAAGDLPGRDQALGDLEAAWQSVLAEGRPRLVEVVGEAGFGKSRLLETFAARARDRACVVTTTCDELGRDLPLQPVIDAVRSVLMPLDDDARQHALGPDTTVVAPLVGLAEPAATGVGDGLGQHVVLRALLDVVHRAAQPRPLVLVVDDVHLADRATLAWLRTASRPPAPPALVVAARRVEEGDHLPADTVVSLGPLDLAAVAAVVGADRAAAFMARTDGNPLFLRHLADGDAGAETLPASLRDVIAERVRRAGPAASTLTAAAVLGPDIDLDLLVSVLDRGAAEVLDHLEEGLRRRVLQEDGAAFRFAHALVREALAATTTASRRAWLHRQAAHALSRRVATDPAVLAWHARQAGERSLTAQGLVAAARIASARFDHVAALELLDEAASLDPTPSVQRRRAQVLLQQGRYDEATQTAGRALGADPSADSYEVLSQAIYYQHREFVRAAELARTAAALAPTAEQRVRCLAFAGRCYAGEGLLRQADDLLTATMAEPASAAVPDLRLYLGAVRMHEGRSADSLELMHELDAAVDTLAFAPVVSAMMRGLAHAQLGRPLEAMADFDLSDRMAEERRLGRYAGRTENCRGYVLRNLGRIDEAREWNERAEEAGRSIRQLEAQGHAVVDLADDRIERRDWDGAAELLQRALDIAAVAHVNRWRHLLRRELLQSRMELATGDAPTAEERAAALVDSSTSAGVERYLPFARLVLAAARRARGKEVELRGVADDLDMLTRVAGMDGWRATLDAADWFGVPAWRALGLERAAALARAGGPLGDGLVDYATRRPSSTSIRVDQR